MGRATPTYIGLASDVAMHCIAGGLSLFRPPAPWSPASHPPPRLPTPGAARSFGGRFLEFTCACAAPEQPTPGATALLTGARAPALFKRQQSSRLVHRGRAQEGGRSPPRAGFAKLSQQRLARGGAAPLVCAPAGPHTRTAGARDHSSLRVDCTIQTLTGARLESEAAVWLRVAARV